MYYPIQIPYKLDYSFSKYINYTEEYIDELSNYVICYWQMTPKTSKDIVINNVIVADGCIDLIVDFNFKTIGFTGMSSTEFNFDLKMPAIFFGLRLYPGAFYLLTGLPTSYAMDTFLDITKIYKDFDLKYFFTLSINDAKKYLINFFQAKQHNIKLDQYTQLFNLIYNNIPESVEDLSNSLSISKRQCQRIFNKHYGISPKKVLSIIRFQKCLSILISKKLKQTDLLQLVNYYDQSHFINDFKQNLGITPFELVSKYSK